MTFLIIAILVIAIVILCLIMPSTVQHSELKKLEGKYITHRGLHKLEEGIPENSLTAFRLSAAKGYPIETDIRLTKDGEVVVFHDATLERVCGVNKRVYDLTLKELKEYTLFDTDEKIPTLRECLAVVGGEVPLLIEFKDDLYPAAMIYEKANEILKNYSGDYFVQSFDPRIVAEYKKKNPEICRGQLSTAYAKLNLSLLALGCLFVNCLSRPDFVSYEYKHRNNVFFKIAKLLGAFPICWTLQNPEELKTAKKHFKAYIFEGFKPETEE